MAISRVAVSGLLIKKTTRGPCLPAQLKEPQQFKLRFQGLLFNSCMHLIGLWRETVCQLSDLLCIHAHLHGMRSCL